jgi:hypothetical protein|tara:strand:- start:222 stop:431 length:210 start_codon:yes stop_codon:yes gene_type:complete
MEIGMKKLRIARVKVNTSKGRIYRGDEVILSDEEYQKIIYMTPDAFEVLDDDYKEPVAPKRGRPKKVQE